MPTRQIDLCYICRDGYSKQNLNDTRVYMCFLLLCIFIGQKWFIFGLLWCLAASSCISVWMFVCLYFMSVGSTTDRNTCIKEKCVNLELEP